MAERQKLEFR